MMDYNKLIDDLRWRADYSDDRTQHGFQTGRILSAAANALSTLQAENEKLRVELQESEYDNVELRAELESKEKYYEQMIDALSATDSADLARVTEERDAAVEELENYMVQDVAEGNEPCAICAKASKIPCECCDPKWRGIKED